MGLRPSPRWPAAGRGRSVGAARATPRRAAGLLALAALALLGGCASPRSRTPDLASIYKDAVLIEARNPVIVVHGILGARLAQRSTGKTVWGAFTSEGIDPNSPEGARALALPLVPPASAFEHDPGTADVYAAGPLEALELDFLFQVISVQVYAGILRALGSGGYRDNVVLDPSTPRYAEDHFTCFSFFYDWRRDNVENAIALGRFIRAKRAEIAVNARRKVERLRREGGAAALREADEIEAWLARGYKFDVVAHSMGGLIARYYLAFGEHDLPADGSTPEVTWAGAAEVDRLVLVGTPNLGAMDALRNLVEGYQPAFILPHFHPALLGTMPAIFQLLPRRRHALLLDAAGELIDLDFFDVRVWEQNGWGMLAADALPYLRWLLPDAADDAARRRTARGYLDWCLRRARQFDAALDQRVATPPPARIYLFAADAEPTLTRARLESRDGRPTPTFAGDELTAPGDATVPRYSAVADERQGRPYEPWLRSPIPWTNVTFLADDHIGLTNNPHFVNNMLFILLEQLPGR